MKINNIYLILTILLCATIGFSENIKGNKMTKIVQVKIFGCDSSPEADMLTNSFLVDKKITPDNLIDIKISRGSKISVMIIYNINYDE